jgi:hypothetical protein
VQLFEKQLLNFAIHKFRMCHQYHQIRFARENCRRDEIVLHIDFSENYSEVYAREVQASHYGYRNQLIIHQGVAYMKVSFPFENSHNLFIYIILTQPFQHISH